MNENIKAIFEKLKNEVVDLHYRWDMYREIYAGDADQFSLLNQSGSNFFYYVQHLMLDHVALTFSKLTDPNRQGKNDNLSLKQVHVYASDTNETELVEKLKPIYSELEKGCQKFRFLRNKRIAHGDLDHAMETADEALPGISRAYVENALEILRKYMNTIEVHYFNSETGYEHTKGPYGSGGAALIAALKR